LCNKIQLTSKSDLQDEQWDVVAKHHKKNHSNRPPELARLSTAALHQAKKHDQDDEDKTKEIDDESEDDKQNDHSRAARHSRSTGQVKADTLAYYRGTPWAAILTHAKIKYRRHIALNHGFPDRDEHLCDARDILLEAIEEYKGENEVFDESGSIYFHICVHSLIIVIRFPTES
jgi:hypothetical protein